VKRYWFLLTLFALIGWNMSTALAFSSISDLQKEIDRYNLKWKAGSSSVWALSPQEKRRLLGWDKESLDEEFVKAHRIEGETPTFTLPESFDWRNVDGHNWMTPVKDQGACGSCWAFAIVGAFEPNIKIKYECPDEDIDLSEQDLVSCACGGCSGGNISCAYTHLHLEGIPDEACDPYQARDIPCGTNLCEDHVMRSRKLLNAFSIPSNIEVIKQYIMLGPLYVTMTVYNSFFGYHEGVYEPIPGESPVGGHAIVMLGWDDHDSSWICKNSWGPGWGMDGYFKIRWRTCGIDQDPWQLVPADAEYPFLTIESYQVNDFNGDGDGVLNPGETAEILFMIMDHCSWAPASNVHISIFSDSPYIQILSSEADIFEIDPGTIEANEQSPFLVEISDSAPPEPITLSIDITANGDGDYPPYERHFEYSLDVSYSQYGWPFLTEDEVLSSPLLLSDPSGEQKLFFGAGEFVYKTSTDGVTDSLFPFDAESPLYNSQCAGDVDGDGDSEIVVLPQRAPLFILSTDGTVENQIDFQGHTKSTPALADLDHDGKLEIVFGTLNGFLYALHADGTPLSDSFPINLGSGAFVLGGIAIGDINNDGNREIVVPTLTKGIFAFDAQGILLPGWPFLPEGAVKAAPTIGKLKNNETMIIVGTDDGYLYILNGNGSAEKVVDIGHPIESSPILSDVDGDGSLEILVNSADGYIFILNAEGENWSDDVPFYVGGSIKSDPCVADFNNDGYAEIVAATSDGKVHLLDIHGEEIAPFPLQTLHPSQSSPSIFDLDDDGNLEILLGNSAGLYVLDVKSVAGEGNFWSMYGATPARTHNYDDINVSVTERTPKIERWVVSGATPNPSQKEVRIFYSLPVDATVKLDIFNVAGRRVKTLLNDKKLAKGKHYARWDLTDVNGKPVSDGVYFFRFKSKNYIHTGKILILR